MACRLDEPSMTSSPGIAEGRASYSSGTTSRKTGRSTVCGEMMNPPRK